MSETFRNAVIVITYSSAAKQYMYSTVCNAQIRWCFKKKAAT